MPSPAARQFHGISWLVLVVALGLILFSLAQKAYRLTLPTDGWSFATGAVGSTDEDRPTYLRNLLDQPSPLQRSDRLLAVEGRSFEQILAQAYATQVQPLPNWLAGQTVVYTVERHGQPVTLQVPLYTWSFAAIGQQLLTSPLLWIATLLAAMGWFVFLKRRSEWAAHALLLFSICPLVVGISSAVVEWSLPELLTPSLFHVAVFFSNWIFAMVMFPSLLLLTLVFPQPKPFVQQHARLVLPLLYGLFPLLLITFGPVPLIGYLSVLIMALLSLAALIHSLFTTRDPVGRAQMRWAAGGLVILVLGFIPINLEGLGWWPTFAPWLEIVWFPMLLMMVTLGFAMAILRYRLFDIDILINRALVYGAITLILTTIWVISTTLIQQVASQIAGAESAMTATVIATVVVISLFQPLRTAVESWVNERFYPENLDLMRDFLELSLPNLELLEIAEVVVGRIGPLMQSSGAVVFLNRNGNRFEAVAQWQMPLDDLQAISLPKAMHDRWGRARAVQQPEGDPFRLLVPLYIPRLRQEEVVGILALGPRSGGQGYSWNDRRGLTSFGKQVGVKLFVAQHVSEKKVA